MRSYLLQSLGPAIFFILIFTGTCTAFTGSRPVSLKKYPQRAFPVPNPMVLSKLPYGKTFQVNHPKFILQFFFSHKNLIGIIFKRHPNFPIFVRWCFFKNCEESPYDYKMIIAEADFPPYDQSFFEVKFPPQIAYQFQGLEFSAKEP